MRSLHERLSVVALLDRSESGSCGEVGFQNGVDEGLELWTQVCGHHVAPSHPFLLLVLDHLLYGKEMQPLKIVPN